MQTKMVKLIQYSIAIFLFYFMRIFKIQDNKIVFTSYYGGPFGDNGKYITLELLARNGNYDIVWLAKDVNDKSFPKKIRTVRYGGVKFIYELATAKVWVDNCRKRVYVRKRKNQYYINTGHGGIPLKKVEKDAEENLPRNYVLAAKHDSKMVNLMTSNAKFRTSILQNSYWYSGEILECGSPKIEQIMVRDRGIKTKVCEYLGINRDFHIAMYAPTFRKDLNFSYSFDFAAIKNAFEIRFGGEWIVIQRLHPNLRESGCISEDVINATNYPDMQELLRASDVLITDYSGTMFEMMYDEDKKVFLYADDIDNYDREYYFNFEELPFPLATNMKELSENIMHFKEKEYQEKVEDFKGRVGLIEKFGAAEAIVNRINAVMKGSF